MLSQSEPPEYASGGRIKSAVNRDRAYKSDEAWEQSYKRKSRPKNPKYDTSDKGIFEKGGYMAEGGETVKYYGRDFVNTFDISKNDFVDAINSYYDTGSDVNYERVSARLNISKLTKKLGEEKSKELFGYIKNKFEKKGVFADGGYMADGGMLKHGLMIGDEIVGYELDEITVENKGSFFIVNLDKGKRSRLLNQKYAEGGELHRLEQGM
jgi:hypothetical protein